MPASRSARAITLAPRSCPSRPVLAMTTLICDTFCLQAPGFRRWLGLGGSNYRLFYVLAPDIAQRIAHLTNRRIGPDGLEQRFHGVGVAGSGHAQRIERPFHLPGIAAPPHLLEAGQLPVAGRFVD